MKAITELIGILVLCVIALAVILGLGWLFTGNDFFLYKYFAPKQESVRREVFEQSKAYNQGMIQELQNMQFQYEQADESHKVALASIILHRAADYDVDKNANQPQKLHRITQMKAMLALSALMLAATQEESCTQKTSDDVQRQQQEVLLKEGTAQSGMPAIKNFRERKMLKDILELRDQNGIVTFTYLYNEMTGKLVFFGETIGYGIPYATQYTNPSKWIGQGATLPQADPNGLFSPASADGTWVLMKDPNGKSVQPVYVEPRIIVSPFKLNAAP